MRQAVIRALVPASVAASALCFGARTARATDCTALGSPVVYVTGSTAAKPLLAEIGRVMAGQATPVIVVYLGQGSCAGIDAILSGTPLAGSGDGAASYWDNTGVERSCDILGSAVLANLGISDVFPTTCFPLPGGLPASVAEVLGPVQAMTFVTHRSSSQKAISAEAAYYVYGFGAQSGVPPWTVEAQIIRRDDLSGTQRMIAAGIGVPSRRWKGTVATSSDDLVSRIGAAAFPDQAIGILSAEIAQGARSSIKVLAYQTAGAGCAVFPDSTEIASNMVNVRDGQYPIWGPLHVLTRLNSRGYPANASAGEVMGYLTGTRPAPAGLDLIKIDALHHAVPQCAMRVQRLGEMGPTTSYAPSGACGCYYEKLADGVTGCRTCASAAECPSSAPVCSYGYCEGQ